MPTVLQSRAPATPHAIRGILFVTALLVAGGCCNDALPPSGQANGPPVTAATGPRVSPASSPASTPPSFDDICTTDGDCGLGMFGPDCCAACRYFEGSKAWIDLMDRYCRGPGFNPRCPVNDCPIQMADPKCVEGHCRLVLH